MGFTLWDNNYSIYSFFRFNLSDLLQPNYTYQWNGNTTPLQTNTATGLCFGLNTVIISDHNNCSIIDSIMIGATDTVESDAGKDTTYCIGTPVNLNGIPGGTFTNVEWFELPGMISIGNLDSITITPTAPGICVPSNRTLYYYGYC